jgi:hypothetical protein
MEDEGQVLGRRDRKAHQRKKTMNPEIITPFGGFVMIGACFFIGIIIGKFIQNTPHLVDDMIDRATKGCQK